MSVLDVLRNGSRLFNYTPDERAPPVDVSHSILLYVENLTVSFDGFRALDNLNLYVDDGELRCLIGANGAGKTFIQKRPRGLFPQQGRSAD